MGRPFHPEQGVNRRILLHLRRHPGETAGGLARILGHDTAVVREQVARLADAALVRLHPEGRLVRVYATEAGLAVLRRRRPRTAQRSSSVHS
jgi:DNA-binding MarR family transcriptional regulator